jgi:transcription elongation GreA/GreB family factor
LSRAFVSEDAAAANEAVLPERPVSPGPNPVTPRGLALIEAEIDRLRGLHEHSAPDAPERAAWARDLRYWRARRASAGVVAPVAGTPEEVVFGAEVRLRRAGAADVTYRIVGEDEADPSQGRLSWASPLAEALLGGRVGDAVEIGGGRAAVVIVALGASLA